MKASPFVSGCWAHGSLCDRSGKNATSNIGSELFQTQKTVPVFDPECLQHNSWFPALRFRLSVSVSVTVSV